VAFLFVSPLLVSPALAHVTSRVSVDSKAGQGNGQSRGASVSANRRFVAFSSVASNLVPGDQNGKEDVFVHDRKTGSTVRVSVDSSGREANGASYDPVISADGRYVAFESAASNLVSGDGNGKFDVFVRDLFEGTTTLVSADPTGAPGNGDSAYPSLSGDGRVIAFQSNADDLVAGDRNGVADVFVRDLPTRTTRRASVASSGAEGDGQSTSPALSENGLQVAFRSMASNLIGGDLNDTADVFVHDLHSGATVRVSVGASGKDGNDESHGAGLSADGRYVVFASNASNLVAGDNNLAVDVFVRDRDTDHNGVFDEPGGTATLLVSGGLGGACANGGSDEPAISASGRHVVFSSFASNLVPYDRNGCNDVFDHDLATGVTACVSQSSGGDAGNGRSLEPAMSSDGRLIAFLSEATNLVAADGNGVRDIFAVDRIDLVLDGVPRSPNPVSFTFSGATGESGNLAVVLLSCSGTAGFPLPDGRIVPITYDACTSLGISMLPALSAIIDEEGCASTPVFEFPLSNPGMTVYAAVLTFDFDASGLISISAPMSFVTQ
jgi:Tol biopolymer transport system component